MELTLKDLEGRPGLTRAQFANSRTAALRIARTGKAVTSAGDDGAINIWRDRRGKLHAAFYRHLATKSHVRGLTLTDLNVWLREWWAEMRR